MQRKNCSKKKKPVKLFLFPDGKQQMKNLFKIN